MEGSVLVSLLVGFIFLIKKIQKKNSSILDENKRLNHMLLAINKKEKKLFGLR